MKIFDRIRIIMYEKQNNISHLMFFQSITFYYGGVANLHKHILHQMKTRLSLHQINSAACGNHGKPRGCCITHSFTFRFTTCCLLNATEESYRNKAIQSCLLSCNSVQYFLQICLKSSSFFFLEKCLRNPNKYWLIQKYFALSND